MNALIRLRFGKRILSRIPLVLDFVGFCATNFVGQKTLYYILLFVVIVLKKQASRFILGTS